jgi:hypothetical protein
MQCPRNIQLPSAQFVQYVRESSPVTSVPLGRHLESKFPNWILVHLEYFSNPGLDLVPSLHSCRDGLRSREGLMRRIEEPRPIPACEAARVAS